MLPLPDLTLLEWLLVVAGATGIGIAKAGFSGVNFVHLIVFALIFGPRESTGIILPMLIVGDIAAVIAFRQHARWDYIRQMLPPACVGVVAGSFMMALASSSVLTITRSKRPVARAASIDHAISGLPRNDRTFLRGMRLLPPRAGMMAMFSSEVI